MQRGQGVVQQRLIAALETHPGLLDTFELAAAAYDVKPDETGKILLSEAQLVAVRRALRGLVNQGAIADLGRHWHDGRQRWASLAVAEQYRERVTRQAGRDYFRRERSHPRR